MMQLQHATPMLQRAMPRYGALTPANFGPLQTTPTANHAASAAGPTLGKKSSCLSISFRWLFSLAFPFLLPQHQQQNHQTTKSTYKHTHSITKEHHITNFVESRCLLPSLSCKRPLRAQTRTSGLAVPQFTEQFNHDPHRRSLRTGFLGSEPPLLGRPSRGLSSRHQNKHTSCSPREEGPVPYCTPL